MDSLYTQALKIAENREATAANIAAVAKETSDEAARWAFTQWTLRQKARAKFAKADKMLFDRDGLEMATHERIAAYHASLFPNGVPVVDLTAGLGADLIALAKRGPAQGYEMDKERAELLRHNLKVHHQEAEIHQKDASETYDQLVQYVLSDPARRTQSKRTLDPKEFSPNPAEIAQREAKLGVIKLSPMLPDAFLESLGPRLEFVSFGGECREALVIFGQEAQPGRFAVHIETGQKLEATTQNPTQKETPDQYLFEADPAAIRAHTLGQFVLYDLNALGDSNGYLTGPNPVQSPWLKQYRVLKPIKDLKEAKKELEKLGSKTPTIKQRGTNQDIETLRRQLRMKGSKELCLILYPIGKSVRYVIAE